MRVAPAVVLDPTSRTELERLSRKRSLAARVVVRSRIILLAADGLQNQQIGVELGVSTRMVALWRGRFLLLGIQGLLKDAQRPGRTPRITAETVAEVVAKTTQTTPSNATQWSTRTMARAAGISEASVRRIWHAHGLKPHRNESFKISRDPEFAAKLDDVVGLYLNPPEHALARIMREGLRSEGLLC